MKRIWVPQLIMIAMLFGAAYYEHPHTYYVILRWVCCAMFTYLAVFARAEEKKGLAYLMGITAVIYNPIIPIPCTKEICSMVNLATIVLVIPLSFFIKYQRR